jgi:hypothetical protein
LINILVDMGNTSSILGEQKAEVVATLKLDYEACQKKGMSDKETMEFLQTKYNGIMENLQRRNAPKTKRGKFQRRPTQIAKRDVDDSSQNPERKVNRGRRRSFGQDSPTQKTKKKMVVVKSESTPALPTEAEAEAAANISPADPIPEADTWDSVVEQPYCKVCEMAFGTMTKLNRHIKYSSLHADTVSKKAKAAEDAAKGPSEIEETKTKQKEGIDFKLLYTGSKYFWRTKTDVEFHIYTHTVAYNIEIVAYDLNKGRELTRVYLDRYAIEATVNEEALLKTKAKIAAATKGGKYTVPKASKEEEAAMVDDTVRVLITSHIMERMQPSTQSTNFSIAYVPLSGDSNAKVVLDTPSPALVPVTVMRRRRTTNEEIMEKMNDLAMDQEKLSAATARAQKMADLMQGSVNAFGAVIKRKKTGLGLSKWAEKWQWACHRVVLQNAVDSYTKQWQAYEAKLAAKLHSNPRKSVIGQAKDI